MVRTGTLSIVMSVEVRNNFYRTECKCVAKGAINEPLRATLGVGFQFGDKSFYFSHVCESPESSLLLTQQVGQVCHSFATEMYVSEQRFML